MTFIPMSSHPMPDFFTADILARQVIQVCWSKLPADQQTVENLTQDVERLIGRAMRDFKEDIARRK